ncbi:outer membrane protein assembly factor BamB family protein [Natronococcus wangiae]|uniref:outer membrane protein assembly factor BamB family protein n=1 Tax=Natronococcus wangiae TaxID=3068275 RepID=UPI00273D07C4|nr:PQQ-binding-like beta-propeller repeat protein [Natronococcus sp. AD5]
MHTRRAVLAAGGSMLLAGCGALEMTADATGSWPQRGYDSARTGHPADREGPEPSLTTGWTAEYPRYGGTPTSPVLADGSVYIAYTDGPPPIGDGERTVSVAAFDPESGDRRWTTTATTSRETSGTEYHADSLAVAGETILIQTANGLRAISTDGDPRWQFDNVGDGHLSIGAIDPSFDADAVYVGHYRQSRDEYEPAFYAIDRADGTERWRHEFDDWESRVVYSSAVVDGVVYLAAYDDGVKALDASDGTERWRSSAPVNSTPTVADGAVFVGTNRDDESGVVALEADTGEVRWSRTDAGESWAPRHLAATEDAVYYPENDRLVARDIETGDPLWEDRAGCLGAEGEFVGGGTPAIVGERIYAGGSGVYVIDRESGDVLERHGLNGSTVRNSIAVVDGWLYANANGRTLYGLTDCETEVVGRCLR